MTKIKKKRYYAFQETTYSSNKHSMGVRFCGRCYGADVPFSDDLPLTFLLQPLTKLCHLYLASEINVY